MAKLAFLMLISLSVFGMLFTGVKSRKLNHLEGAAPKKESSGFALKMRKLGFPTDRCYLGQPQCLTGGICTDPTCICAIEINPNFPPYCINKNCVGRDCKDNEECLDPSCTCDNPKDKDEDKEDDTYKCVLAQAVSDDVEEPNDEDSSTKTCCEVI